MGEVRGNKEQLRFCGKSLPSATGCMEELHFWARFIADAKKFLDQLYLVLEDSIA